MYAYSIRHYLFIHVIERGKEKKVNMVIRVSVKERKRLYYL